MHNKCSRLGYAARREFLFHVSLWTTKRQQQTKMTYKHLLSGHDTRWHWRLGHARMLYVHMSRDSGETWYASSHRRVYLFLGIASRRLLGALTGPCFFPFALSSFCKNTERGEHQNEYEGLSNCRSTVKVRNKAAPLHLVYSFAPSDADAHKREKATRISVAQLYAFQAPTSVLCASGLFLFFFVLLL